ncbi:MAG: biotin/lipoyl-binding protein [Planctomyces sp.]
MSTQVPLKHDDADQLSSPDELDRLLVVVTLRGWIPLLTLLSLCVAAIVWGIFGRIPVTVSGHGILISPGNVKGLQAQSGGQLAELDLRVGQRVEKGQKLGTLSQSSLRTEIEQTSRKLLEVRRTHDDAVKLENSRRTLEQASVAEQSALITKEIRKLQLHISGLRSKNEVFNRSQRENLMRTRQLSEKSRDSLTKFLEGLQTLKKEGLASGQTLLDAERQLDESQLRLADLDVKLSEIDVREIESAENLTVQENRIADLTLQLKKIEIEDKRSQQELLEKRAVRETELNDLQRILDRLNVDLEQRSQLLSP